MKHKRLTLILGLTCLVAVSSLNATSLAKPQTVAFRDTYSREDKAPPADSLGTTEATPGKLAVLDYTELGGCCGNPSVSDIAHIEDGGLIVGRQNTIPAWVELNDAGLEYNFKVEVEFLITDVAVPTTANNVSFMLRNSGRGNDGTVFTPGQVLFDMRQNGDYSIRGVRTSMNDIVTFVAGKINSEAFATADLDGDGSLERGEPFKLRLKLKDNKFNLEFNGFSEVSGLDVSSLPEGGTRLLFGRNRWQFASTPVIIRFDNLKSGGPRR